MTELKAIVNESEDLKTKIKELLGKESYDENGLYDRKFVADQVLITEIYFSN